MKELTKEQLSAYLPFELKFSDNSELFSIDLDNELMLLNSDEGISNHRMDWRIIKPVLFPIESIAKEIEIGGERFVPIEKLRSYFYNVYLEIGISGKLNMKGVNETFISTDCTLSIHSYLYKWKIDIFGLIPAGLAIPVTEEFNPYK